MDAKRHRSPAGVRARLIEARHEFERQNLRYTAALAANDTDEAAVLFLRRRRAIERLTEAQAIADASGVKL